MELTLSQRIILKYYRTKIKTLEKISPQKAAEYTLQLFFTPYVQDRKVERPATFHRAEHISFTFNNSIIKGARWVAPQDNAKTVLICHGMNSCSYRFDKYIELLLQHNFNVLSFDAQGHGQSTGKLLNALIYSEIIEEIEHHFGPADGIIAHSLAGLATTFFLEKHQDYHKKVVLIAPATETASGIDNFFRIMRLGDSLRKDIDEAILAVRGLPTEWYSATRAIQNFKNAVLWIHDEHDPYCPYEDTKTVRSLNLPNLQFITTKGLGHNIIYRDKHVQKRVMDFINS